MPGETETRAPRRRIRQRRGAGTSYFDYVRDKFHRGRGSSGGSIKRYVPLATAESRHMVREHPGFALGGGALGFGSAAIGCAAGGTVTGGIVTVAESVAIHAIFKERGRAAAAGVLVGGTLACVMNAVAGGSLTGTAKLGTTLPNLRRMARMVAAGHPEYVTYAGLGALGIDPRKTPLGASSLNLRRLIARHGLFGLGATSARGLGQSEYNEWNQPAQPGRVWNPVTMVGAPGNLTGLGNTRGWRQLSQGPTPAGTGLAPLGPSIESQGAEPLPDSSMGSLLHGVLSGLGLAGPDRRLALRGSSGPEQQEALSAGDVLTAAVLGPRPTTHNVIPDGQCKGWVVPSPFN